MKIKFVNHSSFIIEHEGISIISDPWLEGKVFNNGWDLISKTRLSYEDFKDINFIWFSHEHPDHFYPPNLKKIPEAYKKNITVLFQHTIDNRVANYCRKAGFKDVIELYNGQYYKLADNFEITCEYFNEGDSWSCFKVGGLTVLNTNDCGIVNQKEADYFKNKFPQVDILLTQFSYAYWVGNVEDVVFRQKCAEEKLQWMKFQCDNFKPKVTIPIASYIYFCHEENFYLNDSVNTAESTYHYLKAHTATTPVILYNGDEYTFPEEWDSLKSIEKYNEDIRHINLNKEMLVKNNPVTPEELHAQVKIFIDKLKYTNNFLVKSVLRDVKIHLLDYNKTYILSLNNYLYEQEISYDDCDVSMSSESLLFCLKYPYGTDTTQINGRLQKPKNGNYSKFYNIFRIDQQKSRGQEMTLPYLARVIITKALVKTGLKRV